MRLLLHIAWHSLARTRLATFLLVLAVTVGTGFQIPNTANLEGWAAELLRKGLTTGYLVVTHPDGLPIDNIPEVLAKLRAKPFVTGVATRVEHAAILVVHRTDGDVMVPMPLIGVDAAAEADVTDFCGAIEHGRCFATQEAAGAPAVILGRSVAERTGLQVGDRVRMLIPWNDLGEIELSSQRYEVRGVRAASGWLTNDREVYIDIGVLRRLLEQEGATHLFVYTVDLQSARADASEVAAALPGLKVEPWMTARPFVANSIEAAQALVSISAAMVMLAVIVPVLALLFIQVLHERRQTATLAAIGFGRGPLFVIALSKAALVGLMGTALGTLAGLGACEFFTQNPLFDNDGFVIRPVVSTSTVLVPVAMVFATVVAGGLWPALRAARSDPATVLRE